MRVVGIDPGKEGGFAWIESFDPDIYNAWRLPHKGKKLDVQELTRMLKQCNPVAVYVEEVQHRGGVGAKQNKARYGDHAAILTTIELAGFQSVLVEATRWHSAILGDFEKGKSKEASIAHVKARCGDLVDLVPGECKTEQDGIADAFCIAEFGWMEVHGV